MLWEEIMQKSPTMKKLVEDKINEETAKVASEKQKEIDTLKAENQTQGTIIADLDFRLMMGGM